MGTYATIILNWNGENDTINLIKSLIKFNVEDIYILDNGSIFEKYNLLKSELLNLLNDKLTCFSMKEFDLSKINSFNLIRSEENLGFAKGNNQIMRMIDKKYDYIILLNNDTIFIENSLQKIVFYAKQNNVDLITCKINYFEPNNKLWNAGGKFNIFGERSYFSEDKINSKHGFLKCDFITGCFLCISRRTREMIGYLTEVFFFGEEDFNYCYLAKKHKLRVGVLLDTIIYHKVSASLKSSNNKIVLHFSNRIVDKKLLYSKIKYYIWKCIYMKLIWIKYRKISNYKKVIYFIKKYSKNDRVDQELFEQIMRLDLN